MRRPRPRFQAYNYAQWLTNPGSRTTGRAATAAQRPVEEEEPNERQSAPATTGQKAAPPQQPPAESKLRIAGRTVKVVRVGKGMSKRDAAKAKMTS